MFLDRTAFREKKCSYDSEEYATLPQQEVDCTRPERTEMGRSDAQRPEIHEDIAEGLLGSLALLPFALIHFVLWSQYLVCY